MSAAPLHKSLVCAAPLPSRALTRRLVLGAVAVLLLLALISDAPARAGTREGTLRFEAPANQPSLTPVPPATEQTPSPDQVTVSYDDVAGRLSATFRLFSPQFWGLRLPPVKLLLGTKKCGAEADPTLVDSDAAVTLMMSSGSYYEDELNTALTAYATRAGYASRATGTMTFDGSTFTATVTNSGLAGLAARCFVVSELGTRSIDVGEWLQSGALSYAPIDMNRRTAERAMRATLRVRFGPAWTSASRQYLKCSPHDWDDEDGGRTTGCMAQFGRGRNWTFVSWAANAAAGDYRVLAQGKPFVYRWTRRWRRNSAACRRGWHVTGTLWSNRGGCEAHLASNYYRGVMWTGGTGSGDFPSLFRYPCRRQGRVLECTNALGDSVRWRR